MRSLGAQTYFSNSILFLPKVVLSIEVLLYVLCNSLISLNKSMIFIVSRWRNLLRMWYLPKWRGYTLLAPERVSQQELCSIFLVSLESRSETIMSWSWSRTEPEGIKSADGLIQDSDQAFVFSPSSIALPICLMRRSLPWRIPFHPCEKQLEVLLLWEKGFCGSIYLVKFWLGSN